MNEIIRERLLESRQAGEDLIGGKLWELQAVVMKRQDEEALKIAAEIEIFVTIIDRLFPVESGTSMRDQLPKHEFDYEGILNA